MGEETKTIEFILGALGLLFFIGMGVVLGYLWNELRHCAKEDKRHMLDMINSHEKSMKNFGDNPLKNLKQE